MAYKPCMVINFFEPYKTYKSFKVVNYFSTAWIFSVAGLLLGNALVV